MIPATSPASVLQSCLTFVVTQLTQSFSLTEIVLHCTDLYDSCSKLHRFSSVFSLFNFCLKVIADTH